MNPLRCRCGAHIADDVVHFDDGPDGFYVVTEGPVATHLHSCWCGTDYVITSRQQGTECVGQMRMAAA